jgi:N-acetylmuramoyl-L-alanine amidase
VLTSRCRLVLVGALVLLAGARVVTRQAAIGQAAPPFSVVSAEGRRALPVVAAGAETMVALDDLAGLFHLAVKEDALAGGVTISYKGRSVILTPGQPLASAAGRIVSLPCPPAREGRRWLVPVEFIGRALSVVYDTRLEVRKASRLVLVGAPRVPRVTVREDVSGPQTRVTLGVSPRTAYTVSQEPGRVAVRFEADAIDLSPPPAVAQGLVQGIHAGEAGAVLVIEVAPRCGAVRHSFTPREDDGLVMIDLLPAAGEPAAIQTPSAGAPAGTAHPPVPAGPVPAPPEAPGSAPGQAAGSLRTIVVDPGHGGSDAGARSAAGLLEKDVTLAVARRLRSVLEDRLGVRVLLTREADEAVDADRRAALANNNMADLFLSLHVNASARVDVAGAQVYYFAPDQAGDQARQVEASGQALPALGGLTRAVELIPWELAQLRHGDQSKVLAQSLADRLRGWVRLNPRTVQAAPLRVLAGVNMPAALVEIGFLTSPDDAQQMGSSTFPGTVAQALLDGILRFRDLAASGAAGAGARPDSTGAARRRP